jgi:hypothetical protein
MPRSHANAVAGSASDGTDRPTPRATCSQITRWPSSPHGSRIKSGMTTLGVPRHPGRSPRLSPSSRPEPPTFPSSRPQRAESRDPPAAPGPDPPLRLRQAPCGSRIKSGMTTVGVPRHPGRSPRLSPSSRPERQAGEPGSTWGPGARSAVGASPGPVWIPDQVRDDDSGGSPWSSRPERSGEPGSTCGPGARSAVEASPGPVWIPDQVRDDDCGGSPSSRPEPPTFPSSRPQRSGEPGSTCGPGARSAVEASPGPLWLPDQVRDDGRIKSGTTAGSGPG